MHNCGPLSCLSPKEDVFLATYVADYPQRAIPICDKKTSHLKVVSRRGSGMLFTDSHQASMTPSAMVSHRNFRVAGHVHPRWCMQPAAQLQSYRGHVHRGHWQVRCHEMRFNCLLASFMRGQ